MPIQTTSPEQLTEGFEGQFADLFGPKACVTGVNESADMPRGRVVTRDTGGTTDRSVKLPNGAAQEVMGITGFSHFSESFDTALAGDDAIKQNEAANLLRKGTVWVTVEAAVVAGDPVFFRHTAGGGGSVLGRFRNDADTASADQIASARFVTTQAAADGIAKVEINLI